MAAIYDLISPAVLSNVARLLLADEDRPQNEFVLTRWFPPALVNSRTFTWGGGTTRTFTQPAEFRAFSTGPKYGTRPGRRSHSGQIPPISLAFLMNEADLLNVRELQGSGNALASEAVEGDVFADVENGMRAIMSRMERVMADFLVNGSVSFNERGIIIDVDAGRDAAREDTVGVVWSDTVNAVPMTDEEAVLDTMDDEEGMGPDDFVVLANRASVREYKATDQVRNAFPSIRVMDTIPLSAVNALRVDHDFPPIVVYNADYFNAAGTKVKVIPDGQWLYVPANFPVGDTQYGLTAASTEIEDIDIEVDDRPGPVAYMVQEIGPPLKVETVVDALGIPVFKDPNSTFALTI